MQDLAQSARLSPLKESSSECPGPSFPSAEFQNRHDKVRAAMDDLGIDLLLVLAPSHVNYLIGTPAKGYQELQVLFFPREPGPLTLLTRLCEVPLLASRVTGRGHPGLGRARARRPDRGLEAGHGGKGLARATHRSGGARLLPPSLPLSEARGRPTASPW